LPQFITSTFPSQIFWVTVGFILVYFFVSKVFTPRIEKILLDREIHVDGILKSASRLKKESDDMTRESTVAWEKAQTNSKAAESRLISAIKEQSAEEKNTLHNLFSERAKAESDILIQSSDEAFRSISEKMDEIVDAAMAGIACSKKEEL
jgi:F0F1-type ATP synthase membrane subunit b/b'